MVTSFLSAKSLRVLRQVFVKRHENITAVLSCRLLIVVIAASFAFFILFNRRAAKRAPDAPAEEHKDLPPILFFNRVPKCGGTTLITLLKQLGQVNNFTHESSRLYDKKLITVDEQVRCMLRSHYDNSNSLPSQHILRDFLIAQSGPYSFDRHVYFVNFNDSETMSRINYINMIRDPVERIISSFYYRRAVAKKQNISSRPWLEKVINCTTANQLRYASQHSSRTSSNASCMATRSVVTSPVENTLTCWCLSSAGKRCDVKF